jgi:hypothetical protein
VRGTGRFAICIKTSSSSGTRFRTILVEPRLDPEDPREIKTVSSIRRIPLVGVALEVMKKFPNGFPSYKENENNFSSAAGKYFRENKLFPTKKHVIYSLRAIPLRIARRRPGLTKSSAAS